MVKSYEDRLNAAKVDDFLEEFEAAVSTAKILASKNDFIAAMLPMMETELDMLQSAAQTNNAKKE